MCHRSRYAETCARAARSAQVSEYGDLWHDNSGGIVAEAPLHESLRIGARTLILLLSMLLLATGCASSSKPQWARFEETGTREATSNLRTYTSKRYVIHTSIVDPARIRELVTTLEQAFDGYCELTQHTPPANAPKMECYVFATGEEWARFTVKTTGDLAPVYLQTRRGGYTFGKLFVARDAGASNTLTVAAHEGLHLFITNHFTARPPPFVEEGLSCCFESVRRMDDRVSIEIGDNAARQRRLALAVDEKKLRPLRELLAMHAGQVIDLNVIEVETFYAQAWAFVRFLSEGEGGRYRPALAKLLADAQAGRLSSDDLPDNPAMIERYLGAKLDTIQPQYDRFVESLAGGARIHRME